MADLLSIARSGVFAAQSRLNTTSNNIANIGTEGYSRQVVEQNTMDAERLGSSFVGTGTYVSDIKRAYNEYSQRELSISTSQYSQAETRYSKLSQLDQLFSVSGDTVVNSLNTLFENVNTLADMPADMGVRQTMITSATQLTSAFEAMGTQINSQVTQINEQIEGVVDRVNSIATELGNINRELLETEGSDSMLLDQQDRLINELSEYVQVNIIAQPGGVKSIMAGGTVMLVAGQTPMELGMAAGDPDINRLQLTGVVGGNQVVLPNGGLGGELQALQDFRDQDLADAQAELNLMALGVADAFNRVQSQGFDLDGNVGANLFTDLNDPNMTFGRVNAYNDNTGLLNIGVEIDDVSVLDAGLSQLEYNGTNYVVTDQYGVSTTLTVDPGDANRLIGATGFSIRLDTSAGTANAGDKWELNPTSGATDGLRVALQDPKGIAAAGYDLTTSIGNGTATLVSVDRTNAAFPSNGQALTLQVDPTLSTFSVLDSGTGATLATGAMVGNRVTAMGFTVDVDSATVTGDEFSLDLSFGAGDSSNVIAMADLATSKSMNGNSSTLFDVFESVTNEVGAKTKAAETAFTSAELVKANAQERVTEESGVNLDEEAANLTRYQQAYAASARVMSVAQEIFDTLFNAVR